MTIVVKEEQLYRLNKIKDRLLLQLAKATTDKDYNEYHNVENRLEIIENKIAELEDGS